MFLFCFARENPPIHAPINNAFFTRTKRYNRGIIALHTCQVTVERFRHAPIVQQNGYLSSFADLSPSPSVQQLFHSIGSLSVSALHDRPLRYTRPNDTPRFHESTVLMCMLHQRVFALTCIYIIRVYAYTYHAGYIVAGCVPCTIPLYALTLCTNRSLNLSTLYHLDRMR